jgi:hypothetical protein
MKSLLKIQRENLTIRIYSHSYVRSPFHWNSRRSYRFWRSHGNRGGCFLFSKTLVHIYQTTRRHIPYACTILTFICRDWENPLKSQSGQQVCEPKFVQCTRPVSYRSTISCTFLTSALDGGEGSVSCSGFTSRERAPQYSLDRRLGGPQRQSGHYGEEEILLSPE